MVLFGGKHEDEARRLSFSTFGFQRLEECGIAHTFGIWQGTLKNVKQEVSR